MGPPGSAGCSPSSTATQAGASSSCRDIKGQMGSLEMGSWGHFHTFKASKSSVGLSGPTGAWQRGCLQPWVLLHMMLCADATDNTFFEVWHNSPEQTPGKEKLVKSQLLPGRDSWVTTVIALCCLRSPPSHQTTSVPTLMEVFSGRLLAWLPHTHLPSLELHVAIPWDERLICTINTSHLYSKHLQSV